MKKHFGALLGVWLVLAGTLAGCGQGTTAQVLQPFPLTEEQQQILDYLNLGSTAQLFSYQPPEETRSIAVSCYVLQDGTWVTNGGGSISWDQETEESKDGVVSLVYQEDGSFSISLHGKGVSSFQSDPMNFPEESLAHAHTWLGEPTKIPMEEEVPVALFVADADGQVSALSPEDYFTPEKFDPADRVQAVTLTFSESA